ncbi:hypothetical protein MASR2M48_14340 [Spirochaetota bacterium]
MAQARPAHRKAVTSTPATALVSGEKGLRYPKLMTDRGAVATKAARPMAIAPERGGGNHLRRLNS